MSKITPEMIAAARDVCIGFSGDYGEYNDYLSEDAALEVLTAALDTQCPGEVERLRTDLDETTAVLRELIHVMHLGSPLPDWSFGESSLLTRLRAALERKP